jgi:hypothetical protein
VVSGATDARRIGIVARSVGRCRSHGHADPAEPGDIKELTLANFTVLPGRNTIRDGIAAVSARLQNGTLRIVHGACPNLLREAEFYRYETERGSRKSEKPRDNDDHALDALRYLIATIDEGKLGRRQKIGGAEGAREKPAQRPWLRLDNEALWTRIW